jgi:hypothetical protein
VEVYERDGFNWVLKLWSRDVLLQTFDADTNGLQVRSPFAAGDRTGRDRETSPFALSLTWLKAYLSWRVRVAQAQLDDRIALTTMQKKLEQVLRIVRLSTGHVYIAATQAQLESVGTNSKNACTLWLTVL